MTNDLPFYCIHSSSELTCMYLGLINMYLGLRTIAMCDLFPLSIFLPTPNQSHYIEVAQGDIFMEQKMRFGLVLGRSAVLKKIGPIMSKCRGQFFHVFRSRKKLDEF